MSKPVFLIGFMGSGKTTLGKKLASRLNKKFIDLDQLLVERVGMSIPEYFEQHGEANFRTLESQLLKEQTTEDTIVSTGGGSPCFFDNMEWMKQNGLPLYLNLSAKALYDRLRQSNIASRPALKGLQGEDLLAFVTEKLAERAPFYEKATLHVDQINTSIENISILIENHDS